MPAFSSPCYFQKRKNVAKQDLILDTGIKVEIFAGKLDYYSFLESKGFLANLKRHLFIRIIGFKYRRLKSSSLQSFERGKPTEIDYLNGYIVKLAKQKKVPVPVNEKLVIIVKEIEAGKRKISIDNFSELINIYR